MNTKLQLMLLFAAMASAQPYSVGHASLEFTDANRNNRSIPVEVYYPADVAGDDVAVAAGSFPVVAFGHGFVMTWSAYQNIWEMLTTQGFIVAFPRTETGILPSHLAFGQDLSFVIQAFQQLDLDANSPFFSHISDKSAVMGHSMGGGAALLAAALHPEITATAVLAPAETNPSAITAASQLTNPVLIIAGANDCVTPPASNQIPMFEAIPAEVCKTLITIIGAGHCQMANSNFLCEFGELTCSPSPTITRAEQHQLIQSFLVDWLRSTLNDDCDSAADFESLLQSGTGFSSEHDCELCPPLTLADNASNAIRLLNPIAGKLLIDAPDIPLILSLFDTAGRLVLRSQFHGKAEIEADRLTAGMYLYEIKGEKIVKRGKVVK